MKNHCRRFWLGALVLAAMVALAYLPLLPGHFIMDDRRLVETDNPLVTGEFSLRTIWFQTDFALSDAAFWLEWRVFGVHVLWYHVVNIFLQAASGILLWRTLKRLGVPGAWVGAAFFAIHPVAVNSVARIAELKNTLSLFFLLSSAWFYLPYLKNDLTRDRNSAYPLRYGLALIAFILALLSKTTTVMLPVIFLVVILWQKKRISAADLKRISPFILLAFCFGLMSIWFQRHQAIEGPMPLPRGFGVKLADAGRMFWFYLSKAMWPQRLNLVYPDWTTDGTSIFSYLPLAAVFAVLALAWKFRQTWTGWAAAGLILYALTLFPALGFFGAQFLTKWKVSDHLQYLPLIFPCVAAAAIFSRCCSETVFQIVAIAALLALGGLTWQRSKVFRSEQKLFRDTLAKNPNAWGTHNDLGVIFAESQQYSAAAAEFLLALSLHPENAEAEANLAQVLALQGKTEEAETHFRAALQIDPRLAETHRRFANALFQQGRTDEGLYHLRLALTYSTKPELETRLEYARRLRQEGENSRAIMELRRVVRLQPRSVEALNNLAWILATAPDGRLRNGAESVSLAQQASRLPAVNDICVPGTLAAAYAEAGRYDEAVSTAEQAIRQETGTGQNHFAEINRNLLALYRAHKPFHEPSANGLSTP